MFANAWKAQYSKRIYFEEMTTILKLHEIISYFSFKGN